MKEKNFCQICGTTLNMYNKGDRCHAHKPNELILKAVPKVACAAWSKKEIGADHNQGNPDQHSVGGLMDPATAAFASHAFTFHEVGRNDEAGNLRRFEDED